ncbi:MAG: 23S rRNA (adenine(2503)-C(2))-methyltransferase RlmN [Terriglobia bacterium]|nr:23S rRNA (adenine(2503)-C(2))-methyltransferase RlmN [Terriglobia bacterium]
MTDSPQLELLGLDLQELTGIAEAAGEPPYRGKQLFQAIYRQRRSSIDQILTLPVSFRESLKAMGYTAGLPEIENRFTSIDGTVRYLIRFSDGQSVESVWMPEGDGGEAGDGTEAGDEEQGTRRFARATICLSSQVGCAVNCQFCMTALLKVQRNLTAGEIVGQIVAVLNDHSVDLERERINLVFMGQGEPFLNYDNFIKAVRLLVEGVCVPESRMTVSTSGILPRFEEFGREPVRPKLAISLNASNDADRTRVMPINKKWNLEKLIAAAREFPLRNRERLTFEYVLLGDDNDSPQNAREVVELLRGLRAKVNLIALNPGPGIPYKTPSEDRVLAFQQVLIRAGIPAFIRRPRGRDIYAACGQLKRMTELVELS